MNTSSKPILNEPGLRSDSNEKNISKHSMNQSNFNVKKEKSLSRVYQKKKMSGIFKSQQIESSKMTTKHISNQNQGTGYQSRSQVFEYFSLDFTEGIIPAKTKKEINIIFKPKDICESTLRLEIYSKQIVEEEFLLNQKLSQSIHMESASVKNKSKMNKVDMADKLEDNNLDRIFQSIVRSKVTQNNSLNLQSEFKKAAIYGQTIEDNFSIYKNEKLYRLGYILKSHAIIKVKAHYPLLKFVNIKNNIFSVSSLWEKFQISRLNKELTKPLSQFEKKNQLNRNTLFDELRDPNVLYRKFIWDFGYLHNSKDKVPRTVVTEIQNFGGTDLEWSIKLESDSEFELNNPTPNLKGISSWRNQKNQSTLFEIYPQNGILKPGNRQQIRLVYYPSLNDESYEKNGEKRIEEEHRVKAYLSIMNGKIVEITMVGRTISSIVGKLVMKTHDIVLPRIPTNLVLPVIIPVVLLNIGANSIKFSLEKSKFFKRNKVSPEIREIDLENTESSLSSMEKKNLLIFFKPREQRTYKYKATLKVFDFFKEIQSIELTFTGSGWNQPFFSLTRINLNTSKEDMKKKRVSEVMEKWKKLRQKNKSQSKSGFGSKKNNLLVIDYDFFRSKDYQRSECIHEDSEFFFTCEELEFLGVRPLQKYSKFVYLCNMSKNKTIRFKFANINSILVKHDVFQMDPMEGELEPGQICKIKFNLTQVGYPSFYEVEIACKLLYPKTPDVKPHNGDAKNSLVSKEMSEELMFLRIRKASNLDHFTKIFSPEFKKKNYVSIEDDYKEGEINIVQEIISKSLSETMSTKHIHQILSDLMKQPVLFFACMDNDKDFLDEQVERRQRIENRKKLRFQIKPDMTKVETENGEQINDMRKEDDIDMHFDESILKQNSVNFLFHQSKEFYVEAKDPMEIEFAPEEGGLDVDPGEDFGQMEDIGRWKVISDLQKELEAKLEQGDIKSDSDELDQEQVEAEDDEDYEILEADFESENSESEDIEDTQENLGSPNDLELSGDEEEKEESFVKEKIVQVSSSNVNMSIFDLEIKLFYHMFNLEIMALLDDVVNEKTVLYHHSKRVKYWMKSVIRDKIRRVGFN